MMKRILYAPAGLALLVGLWGFYDRFANGHANANYGSYVTWGLWVAMYLFFAGIATGAYMVAALDYLFGVALFKGAGKLALLAALVTMPAALASIGLDLGHMERIWKVYLQPNFGSVMAQLVWGYSIFTLVVAVTLWLTLRPPAGREQSPLLKPLMVVGCILAIFLSGGVGALLGVNASRTSWHVGMLPAQFPIFSLMSGVALLLIVIGWFGAADDTRRSTQLRVLGIALMVLLLVKAYYLWTDFSQALYQGGSHGAEAVNLVLFGRYGWAFWLLQLGLGMLVPLAVLSWPRLARNGLVAGGIGVLVLVGMAVARANIIFPALSIPELQGLSTAFSGPHLGYDYYPSLMEWAVTLGIVGGSTLAFLIGADVLPLFPKQTTGEQPRLTPATEVTV
jgi:molybdopterin-containing oxidoreductase family membrane subunit